MKQFLTAAVLLAVGFGACKKVSVPTSVEDELRAGNWKITVATLQYDPHIGRDTVYNLLADAPNCTKDDYFIFDMNFKGRQVNPDKCSPAEPDETLFRWELFPNDSGIHIWDANQTQLGTLFIFTGSRDDVKSPFLEYSPSRFTIGLTEYLSSMWDPSRLDTFTYRITFTK